MNLGVWEIVLILISILIIFGAGKLPSVMSQLGKGIKNFKKELNGETNHETIQDETTQKTTNNTAKLYKKNYNKTTQNNKNKK